LIVCWHWSAVIRCPSRQSYLRN